MNGFIIKWLIININTAIWLYIGYRMCKKFLLLQDEDQNNSKFTNYKKIYKACKEIEFKFKCRTMIDYDDASMIRIYDAKDVREEYLDTIIKDIVDKYLNHPYKGIIVIDNYLSTSLDEHIDCMDDI